VARSLASTRPGLPDIINADAYATHSEGRDFIAAAGSDSSQ